MEAVGDIQMVTTDSIDTVTGIRTVTQDYGDGTGLRVEYDDNGNITAEPPLTGLSIPQTAQQSLTALLDTMDADQAAPIAIVLGWIATLTVDQATTLVALLTNALQGDPQ